MRLGPRWPTLQWTGQHLCHACRHSKCRTHHGEVECLPRIPRDSPLGKIAHVSRADTSVHLALRGGRADALRCCRVLGEGETLRSRRKIRWFSAPGQSAPGQSHIGRSCQNGGLQSKRVVHVFAWTCAQGLPTVPPASPAHAREAQGTIRCPAAHRGHLQDELAHRRL